MLLLLQPKYIFLAKPKNMPDVQAGKAILFLWLNLGIRNAYRIKQEPTASNLLVEAFNAVPAKYGLLAPEGPFHLLDLYSAVKGKHCKFLPVQLH